MTTEIGRSIELVADGMTCGHCVRSVIEELREARGVTNAEVILNSGVTSKVTAFTSKDVNDDAPREAVTETGFELVSISRDS